MEKIETSGDAQSDEEILKREIERLRGEIVSLEWKQTNGYGNRQVQDQLWQKRNSFNVLKKRLEDRKGKKS